jgi:hypothetical protein
VTSHQITECAMKLCALARGMGMAPHEITTAFCCALVFYCSGQPHPHAALQVQIDTLEKMKRDVLPPLSTWDAS